MTSAKIIVSLSLVLLILTSVCAFASSESAPKKNGVEAVRALESYLESLAADDEAYKNILERYTENKLTDFEKMAGMTASYSIDDKTLPDFDYYVLRNTAPSFADFAREEAADYDTAAYYYNDDKYDLDYDEYIYPALEYFTDNPYITLTVMTELDDGNIFETVLYYKTETVPVGNSGKTITIPIGFKRVPIDEENVVANFEYNADLSSYNSETDTTLPIGRITIYQREFKSEAEFRELLKKECELADVTFSIVPVGNQQMYKIEAADQNSVYTVEYWFFDGRNGYTILFEVPASNYGFMRPIVQSIH